MFFSFLFQSDVASIASVDWRKGSSEREQIERAARQNGVIPQEYLKTVTRNKYMALFTAFASEGVTDLLISLPGVGAFNNDVEMVKDIVNELVVDKNGTFHGVFNSIRFNVLSFENAKDRKVVEQLETLGIKRAIQ